MESRTRLVNYMKELGEKDLCVAFSGGVDSSVILRAACEAAAANGKSVYAVTFETKLHPKADLPQAQRVAKEAGAIHHVIYVNELDNEEMLNNPENRCYLCKKYLFQNLLAFAAEKGIDTIMEGNNADDLHVYRPGTKAVKELGVLSPLAELIREKALRSLNEEVPHGIAVSIDQMKARNRKLIDIDATIICERDSHKGIIIGKQGAMLKKIGSQARPEIEDMLGKKVNLKLWVKVKKDWRDSDFLIKNFGYDKKEY